MTLALALVATGIVLATVGFMLVLAQDRWWTTPFGQSLMIMSGGITLIFAPIAAHHWIGDYHGHTAVALIADSCVLVAMVQRAVFLAIAQWRDRRRR